MNPDRHLLYERLYNYVLDDIRKGSLRSGDRVPSEKELARKHGVSRITSMRALQNLERAGLVERIRGKGTFVAQDLGRLPETSDGERSPRSRRQTSRIAFLLPDASPAYGLELLNAIEDRLHGYRAAFSQRGLGLEGQHLLTDLTSGFPNPESGIPADHDAIREFLQKHESITGFVASEHPIALIVRDVLRELDRLEGTLITCFDSPRGQFVEPRFTHV